MTNPDNVGGLLPCPFCGAAARLATEIDDDGFDVTDEPERWVECTNSDCRGRSDWSYDPDLTAAWWNRRELCRAAPAGGDVVAPDAKFPDDGNGDDDAYNKGWNDCRAFTIASKYAKPKDSAPAGSGEVDDWMVELFDEVYEREWNRAADEADDRHKAIIGPADRHATREAIAALLRKLQQGADRG